MNFKKAKIVTNKSVETKAPGQDCACQESEAPHDDCACQENE